MLLLTGAAGWILLAATPGELAGWPHAPQGQPPAVQRVAAGNLAPAGLGSSQSTGAAPGRANPHWSHGTSAPRFDPSVRPAALEQPVASGPTAPGSPPPATESPAAAEPLSITPPGGRPAIPLARPGESPSPQADGSRSGPISLVTVVGSLGLVLGIFLLAAWGIRRATPTGLQPLPQEVFRVLGRAPLAGRQQAHLLHLGNKLVLVSVTPTGAETLAEITDPVEVDRLAGLCRQAQPGSASAVFRQVLGQFAPSQPATTTEPLNAPGRRGNAERYHG